MTLKLIGIPVVALAALSSGVYVAGLHARTPQPAESTLVAQEAEPPVRTEKIPERQTRAQANLKPSSARTANATEALAAEIAGEFIKQNPMGPLLRNGELSLEALDQTELITRALEELTVDTAPFTPVVDTAGLVATPDSSPAALTAYIAQFNAIIAKHVVTIGNAPQPDIEQELARAADTLARAVADLHALPVPERLLDLHAREIALLSAEQNILRAFANGADDPVLALAAYKSFPAVLEGLEAVRVALDAFARAQKTNTQTNL